jgi:hypothetical protein
VILRTKHFGLQTGYAIAYDLSYGITLGLGRRESKNQPKNQWGVVYRLIISIAWNWLPTVVYRDEDWMLNEPGYVKGIALRRPGIRSSAWTGRSRTLAHWHWPHAFSWSLLSND